MIRWTLYTLAFAVGLTFALAGFMVALTLWALGIRFDTPESTDVPHTH